MRRLAPFCLATFLSLAGLSCAGAVEPPLAVHVDWGLDSPAGMIPSSVTQLTVLVYVGAATDPQSSINTVANLDDVDHNGHPDLVRGDLPTGVPIRMTIQGQAAGGALAYLGHAGPFTLVAGERRYVELRMFQVGSFTAADAGAMTPRMLATATALSDGRVLIAGGFTRAVNTACPPSFASATCFDLTAAGDAFIFDVASGALLPVHGGLRQARGGHTATLLPGDRVLIAGGAAHALLALVPVPNACASHTTMATCAADTAQHCSYSAATMMCSGPSSGFTPVLQSLDTTVAAGTSFEVFLPDANAETVDIDRNGDAGRGGFAGAADDATALGRLDSSRFMHAAAVVPGHATQVLLAGGIDSPDSWVIYDDARAGGYGVLDSTMNHLHASRAMPSIAPVHGTTGDALWIIGGGDVTSNADLAEIWSPSATLASGSTVAASSVAMHMFPDGDASVTNHPEYALIGATAVPLDATHAVVVGWYGPYCDPTAAMPTAPVFAGAGLTRCEFTATGTRSFTVDGMTGRGVPTTTHSRHAFGAGVRMSDGSVLVTGGIGGLALTTTNATEQFAATVPASGVAQNTSVMPMLTQARLFHAMAALADQGAFVVGGLSINTTGTAPSIGLVGAPELLYLPRATP